MKGLPILVRILQTLAHLDPLPTVVVSPGGRASIAQSLSKHGLAALLVEQAEPKGMGNAILCFRQSEDYNSSDNVLLIWGDIPFIQKETVDSMIAAHFENENDFTFVTAHTESAYTKVQRDAAGKILNVTESREFGGEVLAGERDIGLFIFRRDLVLDLLKESLPGKIGENTKEHGFLYIIGHLASRGYKVEGTPVAKYQDIISLNRIEDIRDFV